MNTTHENIDKTVPICTTSRENTYELFSSFCSDLSCICLAHTVETAATNPTPRSFAAALCCCRTMKNTHHQPTPERKRRHTIANARLPIPRATTGAPQPQKQGYCEPAIFSSYWDSIQTDRRLYPRIDCHQWSSTPVAVLP